MLCCVVCVLLYCVVDYYVALCVYCISIYNVFPHCVVLCCFYSCFLCVGNIYHAVVCSDVWCCFIIVVRCIMLYVVLSCDISPSCIRNVVIMMCWCASLLCYRMLYYVVCVWCNWSCFVALCCVVPLVCDVMLRRCNFGCIYIYIYIYIYIAFHHHFILFYCVLCGAVMVCCVLLCIVVFWRCVCCCVHVVDVAILSFHLHFPWPEWMRFVVLFWLMLWFCCVCYVVVCCVVLMCLCVVVRYVIVCRCILCCFM